jgi:hypothetical protein
MLSFPYPSERIHHDRSSPSFSSLAIGSLVRRRFGMLGVGAVKSGEGGEGGVGRRRGLGLKGDG